MEGAPFLLPHTCTLLLQEDLGRNLPFPGMVVQAEGEEVSAGLKHPFIVL